VSSDSKPIRQWKVETRALPEFPAPGADEKSVAAAFKGYMDHGVCELQTMLRNVGITPGSTLSAELVSHMVGSVNGILRWQADGFKSLRKRVDELEAAPIRYRGVWQRSDDYKRGHVVTDAGSAWHAVKDVPPGERPGVSDCWQLMVKAGKDARP
jgi:hypothetical protein